MGTQMRSRASYRMGRAAQGISPKRDCRTLSFRTMPALKAMNVAPDFDHSMPESDTRIAFVHRKLAGGDIYFLDNRNNRDETVDASFRVTGKAPELWYAEAGKTEPRQEE